MLTDNEIRLKIAELKGWRDLHPYNEHPLKPGAWKALTGLEGKDNNTDGTKDVPNWPTDISAAWELVEEIEQAGHWVQIRTPFSGDGYWCGFTPDGCSGWNGTPDNYTQADTAARAICLAWLKWKGVEV